MLLSAIRWTPSPNPRHSTSLHPSYAHRARALQRRDLRGIETGFAEDFGAVGTELGGVAVVAGWRTREFEWARSGANPALGRVLALGEEAGGLEVRVVGTPIAPNRLRALYFTRATAPHGDGPLYHHIGMYAYRRYSLERFVTLKPSVLEIRERLEQLRAIEDGMRIDVGLVDTVPLGVDTPEDLERVRREIAAR